MTRACFRMQVKPSMINESILRHRIVWPEDPVEGRAVRCRNYSTVDHHDALVIRYFQSEDSNISIDRLGASEGNSRSQHQMARFLQDQLVDSDGLLVELLGTFNGEEGELRLPAPLLSITPTTAIAS